MSSKILLAGIGGQGVLFAHHLLAECAVAQGLAVTGAETHGMSQRGGSVVSHLKIGESLAPLIRQSTADFLLAFDATEAHRTLPYLRRGGTVIVNSGSANFPDETVRPRLDALQINVRVLDADAIARGLERVSVANVALLGFASTSTGFPLEQAALRETIIRVTPQRIVELNLKAFDEAVQVGITNVEIRIRDSQAATANVRFT